MSDQKINLLIIGTGMYVCGRGTNGFGTIMPAVLQFSETGGLGDLFIAGKTAVGLQAFDEKFQQLSDNLKIRWPYLAYPSGPSVAPDAFRRAIEDLPDPGAVIIVTPDHLHFEMAKAVIESGKHVLVVKPLVPTVKEACSLTQLAEEAGVYGAVEFHKRWDWANLKLKEALAGGQIGDPLYFHIEYSQRKQIPVDNFSSWAEQTNIFQYLGVHYADMIHFVTGAKPKRLVATSQSRWLTERNVDTPDAVQVLIEWDSGFVSTFLTNWVDPNCNSAVSQQMIKVVGTKGRYESEQTDRGIAIVTDENATESLNPYFCQPFYDPDCDAKRYRGYGIDSVSCFLNDVLAMSRNAVTPSELQGRRPTFSDALVSTAIIEGVNMSLANNNEWVCFSLELEPFF